MLNAKGPRAFPRRRRNRTCERRPDEKWKRQEAVTRLKKGGERRPIMRLYQTETCYISYIPRHDSLYFKEMYVNEEQRHSPTPLAMENVHNCQSMVLKAIDLRYRFASSQQPHSALSFLAQRQVDVGFRVKSEGDQSATSFHHN